MDIAAAKELAREMPLIEDRLRRAGLFETAVLMNKAVQHVGYEIDVRVDTGLADAARE